MVDTIYVESTQLEKEEVKTERKVFNPITQADENHDALIRYWLPHRDEEKTEGFDDGKI
ncbi:MAG: hypothetical protein JWQ35_2135 [Bacteriovoracaceae bacterium]|nr:hypothetical protein [Bacteriovoracaceae bacterium]